jgi:hypothetical protein
MILGVPWPFALIAASVVGILIVLAQMFPDNNYLLAFATDGVALLVGLFLVEKVLQWHDAKRWRSVDAMEAGRLAEFAEGAAVGLVMTLGFDVVPFVNDRARFLLVLEEEILPSLGHLLRSANEAGFKALGTSARAIKRDADDFIRLLGYRAFPEDREALLTVQAAADSIECQVDCHAEIALSDGFGVERLRTAVLTVLEKEVHRLLAVLTTLQKRHGS